MTASTDLEEKELAQALAKLSEQKKQTYQAIVRNFEERSGDPGNQYRIKIAATLAKDLRPVEAGLELESHRRREVDRLAMLQRQEERNRASQAQQPAQPEKRHAENQSVVTENPQADQLDGSRTLPGRYSELQRTHQRVAEELRQQEQQRAQARKPEPAKQEETLARRRSQFAGRIDTTREERAEVYQNLARARDTRDTALAQDQQQKDAVRHDTLRKTGTDVPAEKQQEAKAEQVKKTPEQRRAEQRARDSMPPDEQAKFMAQQQGPGQGPPRGRGRSR